MVDVSPESAKQLRKFKDFFHMLPQKQHSNNYFKNC